MINKKIRAWVSQILHVLPDPIHNKDFWKFTFAEMLISQGYTFYSTALPSFIAPKKSLSGRLGTVRAVGFGAQLAADVVMGPVIDKTKTSTFLSRIYSVRGMVLTSIPALYFLFFKNHNHATFPYLPLLAIMIGISFLQSTGVLASNVAYNRILGGNQTYYNKANAINAIVSGLGDVAGPISAGIFIGWANAHFGALAGNVLSFGICGLAFFATAIIFRSLVSANGILSQVKATTADKLSKVWSAHKNPKEALKNVPARLSQIVTTIKLKGPHSSEMGRGLNLLWHNRFLRLMLLFSTLSLISDPMLFLTFYIGNILKVGASPAFLAHWPWLSQQFATLIQQPATLFGFFLAASSLGSAPYNLILMFRKTPSSSDKNNDSSTPKKPSKIHTAFSKFFSTLAAILNGILKRLPLGENRKDLTPLEQQGIWSSILNGFGWIAGLSFFFTSHLWLALGAFALSSLLQSAAGIIWYGLQQGALIKDYPNNQAQLWAVIGFYNQVFSMAGDFVMGWFMTKSSTPTVLAIIVTIMGGTALLAFIQPYIIFRKSRPSEGNKPQEPGPQTPIEKPAIISGPLSLRTR